MHKRSILLAAVSALTSALAGSASAALWTSHDTAVDPSDNTIWSNPLNWGGTAPIAGDPIELGIPVANGSRITNNDFAGGTQFSSLWLKANLNEANGNAIELTGNSIQYTAGGSSVGKIGLNVTLTQDTTYSVSANTSNGRLEVGGDITGAFGIIKADAGRLRFVGTAKTYTGNTTVTGGLLDMSATEMLPFGAGKGSIFIGTGAQLFLNNVSTQINGLNDHSGAGGSVIKSGSNTRNLTLGNGDASGNFSGTITFTGGSSTVNKVGAGTQILSGPVSVAGAGVVSGGGLIINGTWTGAVTVNTPGTLGGTGSISGAVSGTGIVSPGQSIGALTVGSYGGSGTLAIELDGAGAGSSDLINVTGAMDLTSLSVDFSVGAALDDAAYIIARYGSLVGTQFANVVDLPGGATINYAYNDGVSSNNIAVVIPEPAALGLLAGAALLGIRRRR